MGTRSSFLSAGSPKEKTSEPKFTARAFRHAPKQEKQGRGIPAVCCLKLSK